MKKASDVLLLVGTILMIVSACLFGLCAILFALIPSVFLPYIEEIISESPYDLSFYLSSAYIIFACITYIENMIVAIIGANVCARARQRQTKFLYIACIVFGAMVTAPALIGGIFGLVALNQEEQNKNAPIENDERF